MNLIDSTVAQIRELRTEEDPDAEEKMLELARFYSEDMPKPEDAVEEFRSFRALYSELNMDLTTDAVLPFLIANDMDRAPPHLTILHRIYKTLPISSTSTEQSFSRLCLIKTYLYTRAWMRPDCPISPCCVWSGTYISTRTKWLATVELSCSTCSLPMEL